jgi:CheY-like chemotaxis protein
MERLRGCEPVAGHLRLAIFAAHQSPISPAASSCVGRFFPPEALYMSDAAKTVLLVEDNEDNRTVYRTILEHFGFEVVEARNGEDGIRMAREQHPNLILMDISIPVIDGWEATKILKADENTRHIPIIALTAHALATDRAKAEEVGCDGYLAKPCEPRRVVAEVERFLGAGRTATA